MEKFASLRARASAFLRNTAGSIAVVYALSSLPMMIAIGVGVDYARGMVVRSNMADALDSAALAVGAETTKPSSCTSDGSDSTNACAKMQAVAQKFFNANYKPENGVTSTPTVTVTISGESVVLTTSTSMPTTFLKAAGILGGKDYSQMTVNTSSTVVWGQSKLWVALVLDNSGSMASSDSSGSKMDALKAGAQKLLVKLQSAAATNGDVLVGIVPFTRSVNYGTSTYATSTSIDWGEWDAPPKAPGKSGAAFAITNANKAASSTISTIDFSAYGPGDDCPFTDSSNNRTSQFGFYCTSGPANSASKVSTIPSSGTYKGYICPGIDYGEAGLKDHNDRYYNGCYTSTKNGTATVTVNDKTNATCNGFSSSNCTCSGSGGSKVCKTQKWTRTWVSNSHSTWGGCLMDRQIKGLSTMTTAGPRTAAAFDYDAGNTQPSSATPDTQFPAANPSNCLSATVTSLGYNWSALSDSIDGMDPNGSTNQAIGMAHGFQMLTTGAPYGTATLPANTSRYIILFSDGLNTQDRWYGDGSTEGTSDDDLIDTRMNMTCTAAKTAGITVYTLYVHISGGSGNSQPLKDCATDVTKYYDLTSTAQIDTAFADIAQQITNLRVSK